MSGGRLVVVDRLGRDVKAYPLAEGLATIGSDPGCDIRVLLPTVSPHHATVLVHDNQTVLSSMAAGETLLNGAAVSVAALRHGDELGVGGRTLRWEYLHHDPRTLQPRPAAAERAGRGRRRRGEHASLHAGSTSGKQVAIVQPQRRDINEHNGGGQPGANSTNKPLRASRQGEPGSATEDAESSKSAARVSDATKASLWIESRKVPRAASARKRTPLRLAVLRRAQSAQRARVTKIQAPAKIDHTKQAAIMLMTGHTPKPKQPSPKNRPSFVVKKPGFGRSSISGVRSLGGTPKRAGTRASARYSEGATRDNSVINLQSSIVVGPKKSALKQSSSKKSVRKSESIKFDLSNLENPEDQSSDVVLLMDSTRDSSNRSVSDEDISLHYSDGSSPRSPSPRRPIHSRSSRILEKSLGTSFTRSPQSARSASSPRSPPSRKSSRGSLIVERALENSSSETSRYSRRTKTLSDQSYSTAIASVHGKQTRSPRASKRNLESYSIVDLVSMDSNESDRSAYDSVVSEAGSASFPTLLPGAGRSMRSTASLLGSSTPYADRTNAFKSSTPETSSRSGISRLSNRRSASLTTPENLPKRVSIPRPRISRASRSRSRINDSDVLLLADEDASPKSSRRISKSSLASPLVRKSAASNDAPEVAADGTVTPENRYSPEAATTPVLSIQNLLEQSQSSLTSQRSQTRRGGTNLKRKTVGGELSPPNKTRLGIKSKSLVAPARRSLKARRRRSDPVEKDRPSRDDEETVTPKSAAKPIQEGVKNKHSTEKKPQSKRSIIDNLDESDFVKQLFNSPVKRKLSQSMTEFSRKKLFEDDDEVRRRPTRATIAAIGRTPDISFMERTAAFTPEVFVSPLTTPGNSPNLTGLKRLFGKNTPENDLRDVRGVKALLRTPRTRKSIKNDLTDVAGVKDAFARSPRNRLSDVRVKELFASSPRNDLRPVSGVKSLFRSTRNQKSPKNTYEDVGGVEWLYGGEDDDLNDVSGVEVLSQRSQDIDSTFDQLIGKPRIRLYTKPKSCTKVVKPKPKRDAKSLHDSISLITENVEEWLANELKKRVHRDANEPAPRRSTSKSNLTRELQKLTTDTIEGSTPLLHSRSRNGTMTKSVHLEVPESRRSASDIYGAHTLPIKKRSLVAANKSVSANRLPIKKRVRACMHSTPVKGRVDATMNASELCRVSPIAAVDNTTDVEATAGLTQREILKTKRGNLENQNLKVVLIEKPSPKRKRASRVLPKSPDQDNLQKSTRYVRNRKETQERTRRRASLIVVKKQPVLNPEPGTGPSKTTKGDIKRNEDHNLSRTGRKTLRNTKNKAKETLATTPTVDNIKIVRSQKRKSQNKEIKISPKNTRAKTRRSTVIITKPPTKLKVKFVNNNNSEINGRQLSIPNVRSRRTQKNTEDVQPETETVKQRKTRNANKNLTDAKITIEPTKGKKIAAKRSADEETQSEASESKPIKRRGRNAASENISKPELTSNRRPTSRTVTAQTHDTELQTTRTTRNRKNNDNPAPNKRVAVPESNKQKRKMPIAVDPKLNAENDEIGPRTRRGEKRKEIENITNVTTSKREKAQSKNVTEGTRKRGKKDVEDTTESEKSSVLVGKRTRNVRSENLTENKVRRGKKNTVLVEEAADETVGRRTRNVQNIDQSSRVPRRGVKKVVEDASEVVEPAKARGGRKAKTVAQEVEPKTTRGRKIQSAVSVEEVPKRGGRRPKNVEETAVKEEQRQEVTQRGGRKRKVEIEEPPIKEAPAKRTRTTRAAALAEQAVGGRSRRR